MLDFKIILNYKVANLFNNDYIFSTMKLENFLVCCFFFKIGS